MMDSLLPFPPGLRPAREASGAVLRVEDGLKHVVYVVAFLLRWIA